LICSVSGESVIKSGNQNDQNDASFEFYVHVFRLYISDYKIRFYKKNAAWPMHKQFAEIIRNNLRAV